MERKLIQLSPSTLVVSLPKNWTQQHGLARSDTVTVEENPDAVIIRPKSASQKKKTELDIREMQTQYLWTVINALYVNGYDEIRVLTKNEAQRAYMDTIVRYFPGFIVSSVKGSTVLLTDMATEGEVFTILDRIHHMIHSLLEDANHALRNKDWKSAAAIKKRDFLINSYASLVLRLLTKQGHTKQIALAQYTTCLEQYADEISQAATELAQRKKSTHLEVDEFHSLEQSFFGRTLPRKVLQQSKTLHTLSELQLMLFIESQVTSQN